MVVLPTPPFCDAMDRTIGFVLRQKLRERVFWVTYNKKIIGTTITENQVDFCTSSNVFFKKKTGFRTLLVNMTFDLTVADIRCQCGRYYSSVAAQDLDEIYELRNIAGFGSVDPHFEC